MIFQDDSATWNETPLWVHWIYDEQLKLLMICPDIPTTIRLLWQKILKFVGALEWLAFFDGHASSLKSHRMIYHEQSIQKLVHQLAPQHVWVMGEIHDKALQSQVIQSAPPHDWSKPGIKKQLWFNWLKILNK